MHRRLIRTRAIQSGVWDFYNIVGELHARNYDASQTIVVSGSPRSGTTWLMEFIQRVTGYLTVDEPDKPKPQAMVERHLRYPLEWRTHKHPDDDDPHFRHALQRILTGAYIRPDSVSRDVRTTVKLCRRTPLVTKFVRANLFVPFLHRHFPRNKIVQVIRSPYATICSQLTAPRADWRTAATVPSYYRRVIDSYPEFSLPPSLNAPEELLALNWCIEHAYLAKHNGHLGGVHVVRYEDMYRRQDEFIGALLNYLGLPASDEYRGLLGLRSRTVMEGSALLKNGDPTTNYRRVLTASQQARIRTVLERFDYPFCRENEGHP